MEEEAPSRRSVAELAGRFKGSAPPHDAAGNETEKPVRRRPPRSLQLPKTHGDDQEPPGVTSPLPTKVKRNSALIEKLQANLALSPSAMLPSPKSPGFRLFPPAFTPPSPGSAPVTTVTTSSTATPTSPVAASPLTEEEGPASFEAPPTVAEGSILSNINKGRARHSIRRRPPSRRHRASSSGDEVSVANEGGDMSLSSPSEPEDKTTGGGGGGEEEGGGEVFNKEGKTDEVKEDKTDEVKEDKTDEVKEDKKDEVKEDKTDEAKEDKKDEAKEDKTDEVKEDKTGEVKEDKTGEVKEDKTDASTCPEKNESHEDQSEISIEPREEEEKKKKKKEGENGSMGGEEGDGSSSERKEEEEAQEKNSGEKQEEDLTEGATNTDSKESFISDVVKMK